MCPFCQESFAPTKTTKTHDNAKDALRFIADTYGVEALLAKNLFSDIAPTLSDERELVKMFKEKGALEVLHGALNSTPPEQEVAIRRAVTKLPSYLQNSSEVVSLMNDFAEALGWQVTKFGTPQLFQVTTTSQGTSNEMNAPNISKIISFGDYDWRVLEVQDGQALLLSDKVIEKKRYHSSLAVTAWADCELREYLNGSFYDSLGENKTHVIEIQTNNPKNLWSGAIGGNSTRNKIFLLSLEEVDKYFGSSGEYVDMVRKSWNSTAMKFQQSDDGWYISNNHDQSRIAEDLDGEACWWWLRSPGKSGRGSGNVALVNASGLICVDGNIVTQKAGGVRPAMWIKLKS